MNKIQLTLLVLSLCVTATFARTSSQVRKPIKFIPGQTYVYLYRGQQTNGFPGQHSGIDLEAHVILQAAKEESGREILFKLDNIKVKQLHAQTQADGTLNKLNSGEEQSSTQIGLYREYLIKPIQFTYQDGKVIHFIAETSDLEWSINIKKSILSLFQLDLAPTKVIERRETDEVRSNNIQTDIQNETPMVYQIYEESFNGICETIYQLDSTDADKTFNSEKVIDVTKTINFKNCLSDPTISYDRHSFNVKPQTPEGRFYERNIKRHERKTSTMRRQVAKTMEEEREMNNYSPVDRYSYTKYNVSTVSNSIMDGRTIQVTHPSEAVINSIFSESKIKYPTGSVDLISETKQSLELITSLSTSILRGVQPKTDLYTETRPKEPTTSYETVQFELSAQRVQFYKAYSKLAQLQHSFSHQNKMGEKIGQYSYKPILPFALSASWYPIVAAGKNSVEDSVERMLNPDELASSFEKLLISLAEDVIESKESGDTIIRVINIVSFLPKYKLSQVYDTISMRIKGAEQQMDKTTSAKWKIVRKLYLDSLTLAGSKQAIEIIEFLIESGLVKNWEAKELCEGVPANLRYPDTEIVDAFIRISQLPQVRRNRALFASCSIAVGKMIGNAYAKSQDLVLKSTTAASPVEAQEESITNKVFKAADPLRQLPINWDSEHRNSYNRLVLDDQDLMKYIKLFKLMLTKTNKFHEKVIYIETLSHMRVPQVLPVLEPYMTGRLSAQQCAGSEGQDNIIMDTERSSWNSFNDDIKELNDKQLPEEKECNYMRIITIYAAAHLSQNAITELRSLLLPVFENHQEPYEVRIAAFTTMMLSPIPEEILERIASQMWREPNKQVASFVVGTIDTMTKMDNPSVHKYRRAAMKAADSMPKQYLDTWRYSWLAGGDHYNNKKMNGFSWISELIKSNESSIPRAGYFHLNKMTGDCINNKRDNYIQLGFTTKGLESLLRQYIADNGKNSILASILDTLYNSQDEISKLTGDAFDMLNQYFEQKDGHKSCGCSKSQTRFLKSIKQQLESTSKKPSFSFTLQNNRQQQEKNMIVDIPTSKETAKLTFFSKVFDSTSYYTLDREEILSMLKKTEEHIRLVIDEIVAGGELHYVKMLSPSNMWHMVPSQIGLPIVATHRSPVIVSVKIDAANQMNGFDTEYRRTGVDRSRVQTSKGSINVHPQIMVSNRRFLFTVEQATGNAYGVQVERNTEISMPLDVTFAKSPRNDIISFTVEPKVTSDIFSHRQVAKTYIGQVNIAHPGSDSWLGQSVDSTAF